MITLTVNNSYSQLSGLTTKQYQEIRKILSYKIDPKQAYFAGGYNTTRYLIDKKGIFPTGLLYLVNRWLEDANDFKPHHWNDKRKRPAPKKLFKLDLGFEPYLNQKSAVHVAALKRQGIITMPTGYGKSVTMAMLVDKLQLRALIVVPNTELKRQLTENFRKYFGDTPNIVIENIDSPKLKTLTNFDVLIIDEAHHSAAATYRKLNKTAWSGIYYRFFFTATPFRSRNEETILMESITGQVIFKVSYADAVKEGVIVPVEAYYVDVPKQECESNNWQAVYKTLVVNNKERNKIIAGIIDQCFTCNFSILCLVKEIAHGNAIQKCIASNKLFTKVRFANGQDDASKIWISNFNSGLDCALIGTNGIVGEGIDTKPCEYVIIAGLGKSRNAFMQQVGRALRRYPAKESAKVIIFRDASHKFTLDHFKQQCKILKEEYGVIPVKL